MMNWTDAVAAMLRGHTVRRTSESWRRTRDDGSIETGQEGMRIVHAWTPGETPTQVFTGADSRCLVVPDDEHRNATDWVVIS